MPTDPADTVRMPLNAAQLRAARRDLGVSQERFARMLRRAGDEIGEPNSCSKRLVQKWETGEHASCEGYYERALRHVLGDGFPALLGQRPVGFGKLLARLDDVLGELTALRADLAQFEQPSE